MDTMLHKILASHMLGQIQEFEDTQLMQNDEGRGNIKITTLQIWVPIMGRS